MHRIDSFAAGRIGWGDRKSTRLNSSHLVISYAVFCFKKNKEPTGQPLRASRARSAHALLAVARARRCGHQVRARCSGRLRVVVCFLFFFFFQARPPPPPPPPPPPAPPWFV